MKPNTLIYTVILIMLGLVTLAVQASDEADKNSITDTQPATPVLVKQVEFIEYAKAIYGSGIVRPVSEQTLSFKVPGFVDTVLVKAGQKVKKGQVLAKLTLEEMDAQMSKAGSVLDDAERRRDRVTALQQKNLASDEQVRQAQTQVQVAKADLRLAKFNRKHAQIKAPSDGYILQRSLEVNEWINPGAPAFVFADDKKGWMLQLSLIDRDRMRLNLNDSAEIRLDAYPGQIFKGIVREMAGRADMRTQTFEVQLQIQTDKPLFSGLIAHANIQPSKVEKLAKIPLEALVSATGMQASVYVMHNDVPTLKQIEIAYLQDNYGYVRTGVEEGDLLIIKGGSFITPGEPVQVHSVRPLLVNE